MCDPVLSVHSQCICTMEIVHHSCAVHRASCMLLTVRYMQRARPNLYATSCKRASRMYRSCSIHLSRTCTVHKMHGCHLQHGGTVSKSDCSEIGDTKNVCILVGFDYYKREIMKKSTFLTSFVSQSLAWQK